MNFAMGYDMATDEQPVTTNSTIAAIREYVGQRGDNRFTTTDIARHMDVDEYPVRAAVSWLARYGLIEIIPGVRSKRYLPVKPDRRLHDNSYSVSIYRVKDPGGEADFAALMRALFR